MTVGNSTTSRESAARDSRPAAATGRVRARRARPVLVMSLTLLGALVVGVLGLTIGRYPITPVEAVQALFGMGPDGSHLIVVGLRAPRVVVGLLVGAALGMAGALTQTVARNPLASPDILGVSAGAALGAVAAIVLGGGTYTVTVALVRLGVPGAALVGGVLAAAVMVAFAWRGGLEPFRLVLIGVGLGAMLTALTSWLLVIAEISEAGQAAAWLAGSLDSRTWDQALPLAIAVAVLTPLALLLSRGLRVVQLGHETAVALGARVQGTQLGAIACAVGLCAAAVAAAGNIQFVALVAPQVMLRLTGGSRPPLAASAAGGALLVAGADLLGQLIWSWEVPVGLLTAAVGAPYLIWLLTRPSFGKP